MWNANAGSWTELSRADFDVDRDLVNTHTPAFFAMLPSVAGCAGLDLGCGEGSNTRLLAARGANLIALDIADAFVAAAAASGGSGVRFVIADGAVLPFASASFDFVTAFMSLMDIRDPESTLREVRRVPSWRPGSRSRRSPSLMPTRRLRAATPKSQTRGSPRSS